MYYHKEENNGKELNAITIKMSKDEFTEMMQDYYYNNEDDVLEAEVEVEHMDLPTGKIKRVTTYMMDSIIFICL